MFLGGGGWGQGQGRNVNRGERIERMTRDGGVSVCPNEWLCVSWVTRLLVYVHVPLMHGWLPVVVVDGVEDYVRRVQKTVITSAHLIPLMKPTRYKTITGIRRGFLLLHSFLPRNAPGRSY